MAGEGVEHIVERVESFARENVLPHLWATTPDAVVTTVVIADVPALDPAADREAVNLALTLGAPREGPPAAFATDAAALQQMGLPTVVWRTWIDGARAPAGRVHRAGRARALRRAHGEHRAVGRCHPVPHPITGQRTPARRDLHLTRYGLPA